EQFPHRSPPPAHQRAPPHREQNHRGSTFSGRDRPRRRHAGDGGPDTSMANAPRDNQYPSHHEGRIEKASRDIRQPHRSKSIDDRVKSTKERRPRAGPVTVQPTGSIRGEEHG